MPKVTIIDYQGHQVSFEARNREDGLRKYLEYLVKNKYIDVKVE